mmetsp:Transcript_19979/g.43453  ORF Transcript_19979/g.43453 Transcript_19979/m.43453 type:complete len:225 (-) Transcript_19979:399-1073(-)
MTATKPVLTPCKARSGYFGPREDIRNKYIDQDNAPPKTNRSPRESNTERAEAFPPPPMVKTTNPNKATTHPNQTLRPMTAFPIRVEISGVNKTLVCVKKEARPDPVDTNPTVNKPCAKKFHIASSMPERNNGPMAVDVDIESSSFGVSVSFVIESVVEVAAALFDGFILFSSKGGKKHKKASHPRVADKAAAEGGTSGISYTNLSETFRVPYSIATSANKNRPR